MRAYQERLKQSVSIGLEKDIEAYDIAIEALKEQHTEGYWRQVGYDIYECTVCSQTVMTGDICAYKHCHGCGAKMKKTPCTGCKHEGSFGKEFDNTCIKCWK